MGLFDGIKLAADLVKGGIAAFKASEKLEALVKRSQDEFKSLIKPEQAQLYQEYMTLDRAKAKEEDTEKQNALTEKVEAAAVAYLSALGADDAFPKDFRAEITLALRDYAKTSDFAEDVFEKHMMAQAKTEEEKAEVRKALEEMKAENQ
ncbi:MAG: hypothetical protein IJR54_02165 [Oscillibacter sp.]|nr:hypothetical protein [Oscillibacter sp.]